MSVYIDVYIGAREAHAAQSAAYDATVALLAKNATIYGLPSAPADLSEEQREILADLCADKSADLVFEAPRPLLAGRLVFALSAASGLVKTTANFAALCTGERGACKGAPNKRLWYDGCPIHRIVRGFVAQGGDITRGDGSGGESIYGGKFNDEKEGLKVAPRRGSLAMANAGKNTNSSQFFVVLANDAGALAKIAGKHVVFGELTDGWDVLQRLDDVGGKDGTPVEPVWIGGCGKC